MDNLTISVRFLKLMYSSKDYVLRYDYDISNYWYTEGIVMKQNRETRGHDAEFD